MLTRLQLVESMMPDIVAEMKSNPSVEVQYGAKIDRAVHLILTNGVHCDADTGAWTVRSSRQNGEPYHVNGGCTCEDSKRDAHGRCKHRIAVAIGKQLVQRFAQQAHLRHRHECEVPGCGTMVACWEAFCSQEKGPWNCGRDHLAYSTAPDKEFVETEDVHEHEDPPIEADFSTTTPEDLALLAAPPYEPNPTAEALYATAKVFVLPPTPERTEETVLSAPPQLLSQGMPEAPCSVNIKIRCGNNEAMVTLRSMQLGRAGDQEVAERLRALLPEIESILGAQFKVKNGNGK